jgi:MFS family permease
MESVGTVNTMEYIPTKTTTKAWIVCLTASLFFFYEFVQMMMFNAVNPNLMASFHVTATSIGHLSSAYFIANIIFMLPAGILLDRYSTRHIILIAMIVCIGGTLLFSYSSSIYVAMFARFLTGIGGSFPFLCCLRLALRWFPARRLALAVGLITTVAFLGGATGQAPFMFLTSWVGWRDALRIDAVIGVGFTVLIYYVVQDAPEKAKALVKTAASKIDLKKLLLSTVKNKQAWIWGFYISTLNLSVMLLGALWGCLFLMQVYGLNKGTASLITMMIFFGTIVGSPLMGFLSDSLSRRKLPSLFFSSLSLINLLLIVYMTHWSTPMLYILFFTLGFLTSAQIIGYPAISENTPHEYAGSALGLASVLIMLLPAITQPLFGWLMDSHWNGKKINGVAQYTLNNFHHGLMILIVTCIVSMLLVLISKETFCQSSVHRQNNAV